MDSSDTSDNPLLAAPTATPSTGTTTTNNNSSPAATTGGKSSNRNHNYNHSHNNNNNNIFNNTCKGGVGNNNSNTTTNVHGGVEGGGGNPGEKIGGKRKDRKDTSVFDQADRSLYDEDIIDGFAILSFLTYEDCERETIRQERLRKRDDIDENIKSEPPIVPEKAKKARKPRASKVLRTDPADDNGGSLENVNATNTTTSVPVAVKEENAKTADNCTGQPGSVAVPVPAATAVLKPSVHQNNARPEEAAMPAVQPTSTDVTAASTGSENPLLPHRTPSSPSSLRSPPACKPVDMNAASLAAVSGRDMRRASPLQGALGSVPSQRGPWSATSAPLNATPPLHTVAESSGPPTGSALHRNGFPPSPSKKLPSSYPESSSPTLLAPASRGDVPASTNPVSPVACSTNATPQTASITSTAAASISAAASVASAAAAAPTSMSTSTPPSVPVLTSAHLAGVHRPPSAPGPELQQGHVNASLSSLSQLSQSLQPTGKAVPVSGPTPLDARGPVHFPPSPFVGLAANPVPPIPAANQLAASSTAASGGTTHTTNTLTSLVFPKTWSNCPSPAAAIPSSTAGRAAVVESATHSSLALSSATTSLATVTTTTTTTTAATSNATKAVPQQLGFAPGAPSAAPASGLYPNTPGLGLNPPGAAKLGGPFPDQLLQPNADLLRRELDARFIASQDRSIAIPPPPYMRGDLGHPSQTPLPPPFLHLVPGQAPPASLFDPKYAAKLDPVAALKYPGTLPGLPPGAPGFPPHVGPPLMSHANTPTSTTPFTSINPTSNMNLAAKMQPFQKSKSNKTGKWCAMHVRIAWEIYNHQQKNGQATSQLSNAPSVASKGFIQGPPPAQGRSSSSTDHTPKQEVTSKNRPNSSTGSLGPSPSSTPTNREISGVFPNLMPPSAHGLPRHPSGPPNTSPAAISGGNSAYPPYPYLGNLALPPGLPTSVNQRTSSVITSSTSMKHHAQPQHGNLPLPASPKVSQSSPFTSTSRGFPPTTPFPGAPPFGAMPPPPPHGLGFPGQPGGSSMLQGRDALQMDPYRPPMDQYRLGLRPLGPYGALGHHTSAPGLGLPPGMVQGWGGLKAEAEKEDRERKEKEHLESQKKAHEEIKQRERDRVYQLQREQHQQQAAIQQQQQQQQQQIQQQQLHQHHQQQFHQQQQQLHHHHQQQLHQQQQQQLHQQQQQQQHLHQQHQQQQQQQQQLHQQQQQQLHQQQLHHHLHQQQQQQHMIQQHAQAQQQAQQQPQHVLHMMDGILRNGDARHLQNRTPMKNGHPEKVAPRERETRVKEEPEQQGSHKGSAKPADDLAMRLNAAASGSTGALMGAPHGLGVSMWPTAPPISADYYRAIMMLAPPPGSERFRPEDMEKISPYERDYDRSKLLSGMAGPPNPSFIPPPGAHPGFLPGLGAPPQGIPGLRHKLGVSGPGLPGVPMGVGAGAGVPPPLIPSAPGAPAGHMHKLSSMMPDKPMR